MRLPTTPLFALPLGLLGCTAASPPPAPAPAPVASSAAQPAAAPSPAQQAPEEAWRCGGDLVPPTGWQQDTAFVDASTANARQRATELAAQGLEQRLCGRDPASCPALRARITPWKTGSNGKEVCAMAVVKAADLEAWRNDAQSLSKLDADIEKAVGELLSPKATSKTRVTIDRILDGGIPGGQRADWLRARLEQRLARKVEVVAPPHGWAGDGLPPGVDVSLRGELIARREGQIGILEASFRTLKSSGKTAVLLGSARVAFPESAAPAASASVAAKPPDDSPGLSVHVDAHQGGSLCAGERTQIWLKSDADAVVRVINLYGTSDALLVWPDDENPTGQVKGGSNVTLGAFEAVPAAGSEFERFIVIAAPAAGGLGRFSGVKGTCRLPASIARELHEGRGLPAGAKVATDGYRLVSGSECKTQVTADQRKTMAAALAGLRECQLR